VTAPPNTVTGTPDPPGAIHAAAAPFVAACGADVPNQQTTTIPEHVTCPNCRPSIAYVQLLHGQIAALRDLGVGLESQIADLGKLLRAIVPACPYPVSTDPWADCDRPAALRVTWSDRQVLVCAGHEGDVRRAAAHDGDADRTDAPDVERLYTDEALALLLKYWPLAMEG
jgi:hypothetical protein